MKYIKYLLIFLLLLSVTVKAGTRFPVSILDDKTITYTFLDSSGNDFDVSTYTFTAHLKTNRTDADGAALVTVPTSSFTVSGNDASFVLTSANNNLSEGIYYLDTRMFDSAGSRTKIALSRLNYSLNEGGASSTITTTVGGQSVNVALTFASGQTSVADVMTAKGDLLAGTAADAFGIVSIGTNGQFLKADSTTTNGMVWATASGAGDMLQATYDAAAIAEQLTGITATQTLTNKTLTTPTIGDFTNSTHDHSNNAGGGALSGMTSFTVTGNSGTGQTITDGNTLTITGGTGATVIASATDTLTINSVDGEIDHDSLSNFATNEHYTEASITHTNITAGSGSDHSDVATNTTHRGLTTDPHSVTKAQVGLTNVEDTALSTWTGSATITTLGTITTGVWTGTDIADADIDNNITLAGGTIGTSALTLVNSAGANPTTLAVIEYDSTDEYLVVGDGAATQKFSASDIIHVAASDETTDLTVADDKINFRIAPYAVTILEVGCNLVTAATGTGVTVDIEESGTTILSTLITTDATEDSSETAATPPVVSDASIAADAEMSINVDVIGSSAAGKGLKIWIRYRRT